MVFCAPSRGGRGRWADVGFVVCFRWGGIFCCSPGNHIFSNSYIQNNQRRLGEGAPTDSQHNFSKLRERHSPMLARQNTTTDVRKRDIEACVLIPSIPARRCVGVLRVAQSRCPTYHLSCGSSSQVRIGSFHKQKFLFDVGLC